MIHNFVDPERGQKPSTVCKKSKYAPNGEFVLLHASNFRSVKRVPDVVRIFAKIRDSVPAKLMLVGEGPDKLLVQQIVRELGLQNDVFFLGQVDFIDDLLKCADLFLLPSEQESFGLAALEAMNCNVPVIASITGGIPEVVEHGKTGYLFPVGEIALMAEAAVELLENPTQLLQFKSNARKRAAGQFGIERIMPQWLDFYERVMST